MLQNIKMLWRLGAIRLAERWRRVQSTAYFEAGLAAALVVVALLPRYLVIYFFPATPVSDFAAYVNLAETISSNSWAQGASEWKLRAAGLPTILAMISWMIPVDMASLGRFATATVTGLLPLIPWLGLRGIVPPLIRVISASLLAMWPGQILTAGVISADNWVLLPTVGLVTVAARSWISGRNAPVMAAMLLGFATWIRPEMLLVLFPLAILASLSEYGRRMKSAAVGLAVLGVCLGGIAGQRWVGAGHFSLGPASAGTGLLGTFLPGVFPSRWRLDGEMVSCVNPLKRPGQTIDQLYQSIAMRELMRRPQYHTVRALHNVRYSWYYAESDAYYWSLRRDLLPASAHSSAEFLASTAYRYRGLWNFVPHFLAILATVIAVIARMPLLLVIASSVLIKIGVHALISSTPRYFVVTTALEFFLISFMLLVRDGKRAWLVRKWMVPSIGLVGLTMFMGYFAARYASGYLHRQTEPKYSCAQVQERYGVPWSSG